MRGRLRRIVAFPASTEALFVLFLFAGRLKGDERLAALPFDLTAVLFGLSLGAGALAFLRQDARIARRALPALLAMLAFVTWLAMTLMWSPSADYGVKKSLYMGTLVLWAFLAPMLVIGRSRERVERLVLALVLFGLWTAAETSVRIAREGFGGFVATFGADPIVLASTLSLTFLILIVRWVFRVREGLLEALLLPAALGWLAVLMLAGGGRGPMLAMVLSLGTLAVLIVVGAGAYHGHVHRVRQRVALASLAFAGFAGGILMAVDPNTLTTVRRLQVMVTDDGGGSSVEARVQLFREGIEEWVAAPIAGRGSGAFAVNRGGVDTRWYPHNLFIEVLAEAGLIGAILLTLLLVAAVGVAAPRGGLGDPLTVTVLGMVLFTVLSAQVSGDLPDNRPMFMALGLLAGFGRAARPGTAAAGAAPAAGQERPA